MLELKICYIKILPSKIKNRNLHVKIRGKSSAVQIAVKFLFSFLFIYLLFRSGYSYGTRTATCICYSYGSPKISLDFSVIPDSCLSKLLYLRLERMSESSECPFFEPDKFAYSLLTKRTSHWRHLNCFAQYSRTRHAIRRDRTATGICYSFGIPMSIGSKSYH